MESQIHIDLVNVVTNYAKEIVPKEECSLICLDSAGKISPMRLFGNYVPDVFFSNGSLLIIGEAKTLDDFERGHSKEQYKSYIAECNAFSGRAILIISVPWQLMITAKNYFNRIKKCEQLSFEIVILNEIGKEIKL